MARRKLKQFEVRVTWMMAGTYFVKAEDREAALDKARSIPSLPKRKDSLYLEPSMEYGEPERVLDAVADKLPKSAFRY